MKDAYSLLPPVAADGTLKFVVVGCGGTGGFVADSLCRLLLDRPGDQVLLMDFDVVEPHNIRRQNFFERDVGMFKSQALAERLSEAYRRPIGYTIAPFVANERMFGNNTVILGCVDNHLARSGIASLFNRNSYQSPWWIDAGNSENSGQVLIGNAHQDRLTGVFSPELNQVARIPHPALQSPQLLIPEKPAFAVIEEDCAEAVMTGGQGPTINQMMATLTIEVLRRLLDGTCTWMGLYVDLDTWSLRTVDATPAAVHKIVGLTPYQLTERKRGTRAAA